MLSYGPACCCVGIGRGLPNVVDLALVTLVDVVKLDVETGDGVYSAGELLSKYSRRGGVAGNCRLAFCFNDEWPFAL